MYKVQQQLFPSERNIKSLHFDLACLRFNVNGWDQSVFMQFIQY